MKFIIMTTILFCSPLFAQAPFDKPESEITQSEDLQKSKWAEVYSIIDDIKAQNPPRNFKLAARAGFVQVISNSPGNIDPILIGLNNNMPSIGVSAVGNFWDNLGIEAKYVVAKNIAPIEGSPNQLGTFMYWLDVGPRYTIFLDNSRQEDNMSFKIFFHLNEANFIATASNVSMGNHYTGISTSFERSIPVTRKLGIIASLDILQIFDAYTAASIEGPALVNISKNGYGFEIHGEVYYMIEVFKRPTRLGFSYWQQGNNNELNALGVQFYSKNSFFQIARGIFVSTSLLF